VKLNTLLPEEMIISFLEPQTVGGVLQDMVSFLKKKNKISKEKELVEKLLQREKLGSTAIGEGFAIPHCKIKGIKNPLLLLAISPKGVDFQSVDGRPTQIFFLVVSSPENPSLNLQILAAIAQLIRKAPGLKRKILEAPTPRSILEIIREEEEKVNE
jgi:PTS system nitrogen regulatory IIA component